MIPAVILEDRKGFIKNYGPHPGLMPISIHILRPKVALCGAHVGELVGYLEPVSDEVIFRFDKWLIDGQVALFKEIA